MAKEVEKRSGKATRQRYKKDRRETVIQVRMNAEDALDNEAARTFKHRGVMPKMQQTAEATERVRDEGKHLGE